jgi:hypothetical protein
MGDQVAVAIETALAASSAASAIAEDPHVTALPSDDPLADQPER